MLFPQFFLTKRLEEVGVVAAFPRIFKRKAGAGKLLAEQVDAPSMKQRKSRYIPLNVLKGKHIAQGIRGLIF
jgi:hypothetical protein